MRAFGLYARMEIEGIMPERALIRLKRGGIPLYNVKKTQKNRLLFTVKKKDCEKVFAIYPYMCYNRGAKTPYTVVKRELIGLSKLVEFCRKRVGFLLGSLLFCVSLTYASDFVLGVDFVGNDCYARETRKILEEQGVFLGRPYPTGREDLICSKLLSLPSVEYCSVKKVGTRLQVEIRLSPFETPVLKRGSMTATHSGELVNITVLRGTAQRQAGDKIEAGDVLVADYLETQEGEQVCVEPIARAQIACTYEGEHTGSKQEAFAAAYLTLAIGQEDEITAVEYTPTQEGFLVRIRYLVTERMNF